MVAAAAAEAEGGAAAAPLPLPPRLFGFSTEAFPGEGEGEDEGAGKSGAEDDDDSPGFALTGTGRCVHSRRYVRRTAREHGFVERRVLRAAIRKNAGVDVVGDLYVFEHTR